MEGTLINMIRAISLNGNIDNKFWLELVMSMTYIKNSNSSQ